MIYDYFPQNLTFAQDDMIYLIFPTGLTHVSSAVLTAFQGWTVHSVWLLAMHAGKRPDLCGLLMYLISTMYIYIYAYVY
jgi:hypothetical protein